MNNPDDKEKQKRAQAYTENYCIDEVQCVPEDGTINSGEILKYAEQTEVTTRELSDIAGQNKQNALAIREIVDRFSDYECMNEL